MARQWKMKNGKSVSLEKMASKHLAHAYRLCCRKQQEANGKLFDIFYHSDEDEFIVNSLEMSAQSQAESYWIGWASTLSKELSRRGYHRIGDRFVKDSI